MYGNDRYCIFKCLYRYGTYYLIFHNLKKNRKMMKGIQYNYTEYERIEIKINIIFILFKIKLSNSNDKKLCNFIYNFIRPIIVIFVSMIMKITKLIQL